MKNQQGKAVFRTLDDIAMELERGTQASLSATQVQWMDPRQEWRGTRPANEDPWASQVAQYLQQRAGVGPLFPASQRAAAHGE